MPEFAFSIISGIISGFISSLFFFVILSQMRPKLEISPDICKSFDSEGKLFYGFKIINKSRFHALDMKCEVILNTPFNSKGGANHSLHHINLKKPNVLHFSKYNKDDNNGDYAIIMTTREEIEKIWCTDAQSIEIKVHCKHSFSGISKSFGKKYYTKRTSIKDGMFNFGKSFDIS